MNKFGLAVRVSAFAIFVACLPLAWLVGFNAGFGNIKPVHLAMVVLVVVFVVDGKAIARGVLQFLKMSRLGSVFYASYFVYLMIFIVATTINSNDMVRAFSIIFKQVFFAGFSLAVLGWLVAFATNLHGTYFRASFVFGGIIFLLVLSYYFSVAGESFIDFFVSSVYSPSLSTRIEFMGALFKSNAEALGDFDLQKTIIHNIANGLYVIVFLGLSSFSRKDKLALVYWLLFFVLFLLSFILFARTTIISLLIFALSFIFSRLKSRISLLSWLLVFLVAIVFVVFILIFQFDGGSAQAGNSASLDYRSGQYLAAAEMINRHPIFGSGADVVVNDTSVHNLFLRAWIQGGVFALLVSVVFYFSLLRSWFSTLRYGYSFDRVGSIVASGFLVLPLVRSMGTASEFNLAEWTCISLFWFFSYIFQRKR